MPSWRVCETASPLQTVLRGLEVEVLSKTGVAVALSGKTLKGDATREWVERVYAPQFAPDSAGKDRLANSGAVDTG